MNAQPVLRAFILQRIKNWSFRELRERIADGLTLRIFTMFFSNKVPKHDAFNRNFNKLSPETVRSINEGAIKASSPAPALRSLLMAVSILGTMARRER
jgi:IS5 family transposase